MLFEETGGAVIGVRALEKLVRVILLLFVFFLLTYAGYSLWDNRQVLAETQNLQEELLKLKPHINGDKGADFAALMRVNKDVRAWLAIDDTKIDYPVVQGKDNLTYLNMDVYGRFALSGSIYLDSRNTPDFSDAYNLLYGHHMEKHLMFGDLDLFKDREFFFAHDKGTLLLPDRTYRLKIFACIVTTATDPLIFDPYEGMENLPRMAELVEGDALYYRPEAVEKLKDPSSGAQVLAMSTCSVEHSQARTILLALMEEKKE